MAQHTQTPMTGRLWANHNDRAELSRQTLNWNKIAHALRCSNHEEWFSKQKFRPFSSSVILFSRGDKDQIPAHLHGTMA
ncbi:predicted protein [Chaetomium globosum CBS 148.51]|uniref:Uncharacterized protein n=1 Tax=Chaetomium globosum (strain ATCC 6205 / CBS 148.51 / DSM 1962 / NBRC 6347 / NRRL 1970) TaxID=306901 RepID=Q2GZH0_CHAGB|nr:uncharacterized protein CHGG_05076 [Chaetomium globosum CBS 148.51]EAQ88457.1 predicted protein [Chaetomium globosum CBS 148.51]